MHVQIPLLRLDALFDVQGCNEKRIKIFEEEPHYHLMFSPVHQSPQCTMVNSLGSLTAYVISIGYSPPPFKRSLSLFRVFFVVLAVMNAEIMSLCLETSQWGQTRSILGNYMTHN